MITVGQTSLQQGHPLGRSCANTISHDTKIYHFNLIFGIFFFFLQISLLISLFECDLLASGWGNRECEFPLYLRGG